MQVDPHAIYITRADERLDTAKNVVIVPLTNVVCMHVETNR